MTYLKDHFKDCPIQQNYNCCTCVMYGEERAIISWAIRRLEGKEKWYHITAKLTLAWFSPPLIKKSDSIIKNA